MDRLNSGELKIFGTILCTVLVGKRTWTDVEPGECSISGFAVSKKLIHLLRHARIQREDDGAVEFWRIKDNLQKHVPHCHHSSDDKWKRSMARGEGNKNRYQYCTDSSGAILYLRVLQGHSVRSLVYLFVTGQCFDAGRFLQVHFSCRMCNQFTFYHQFRIETGRSKFEKQTDILSACESNGKTQKILIRSTWKHRVLHGTSWKKHQNTVSWVDINLAFSTGLTLHQTRSNAIILHNTLPFYCIPKVVRNWRSHKRESIHVTSALSEDFLQRQLDENIGVQKLLGGVNDSTNPTKIQLLEQGDFCQSNNPVRVFRKSTHVSYLAARVPICLLNVQIKTKTQTKTKTQIK